MCLQLGIGVWAGGSSAGGLIAVPPCRHEHRRGNHFSGCSFLPTRCHSALVTQWQ